VFRLNLALVQILPNLGPRPSVLIPPHSGAAPVLAARVIDCHKT
jgi:hypothetical protein